jgi:hypothetical protein
LKFESLLRGETTRRRPIGKSIQRASREGNTRTRYEVAYRFSAADGHTREGVAVVDVDAWERLAPGDAFQITYLPGAPEMSRAAGSDDAATPYVMIGMGSLFALIGGSVLAVTGARISRERRLLRMGLTAQGSVLAIVPTNVSINRVQQLEVRFQYRDHSGCEHQGTSGPLPPHEAHAVEVGDTIDVRFDQSKPEQSIWVRSE